MFAYSDTHHAKQAHKELVARTRGIAPKYPSSVLRVFLIDSLVLI